MITIYNSFRNKIKALGLAFFVSGTTIYAQSPITMTLVHTGSVQQYTIPCGANSMTIEAWGAIGGTGGSGGPAGANGAYARGVITATPGQVLAFYVGGQGSVTAGGFNGGGDGGVSNSSTGAGGGGASDVRAGGVALSNRILVAAGGGGGGGNSTYSPIAGAGGAGSAFSTGSGFGGAGAGGCATGANGGETGGTAGSYGSGGGGGGFTSGGQGGGQPSASTGGYGCNGALGQGGAGGGTSFICGGASGGVNGGGGGGGGYYGGGGGMTGTGGCNGGGGGGSSYAMTPLVSSPSYSQAISAGHGSIIVTLSFNGTATGVTPALPSVCLGGTTNLTGTGSTSYTWAPVGTFAGSNNTVVSVSPSVNTVYTVSGTNALGCVSSTMVTVYVSGSAPVLTISASSASVCLGRTITLTASGALTYSWTNGLINGQTYTPQVTNTYTVQGANGCGTVTAFQTVTVTPIPVSVLANPTLVCEGYQSTLTAVSGAPTYIWYPFGTNASSVIATPTTSSIYTVAVTDGTCVGQATVGVTTKTTPTITAVATNTNPCENESFTITANGAGSGGTYAWTPGGGTGTTYVSAFATTSLVTVMGTNSLNCTSQALLPIVVKPNPILNISATQNKTLICTGGSATLNITGAPLISWAGGGPATNSYVVNPVSGYNTYTATGTGTNNCSLSKTIAVAVITPSVNYTSSLSICMGNSATLTATGANTYTWNGVNTQSTGILVVTPTITSNYTLIALTQSLSTNCLSTHFAQVAVNANPTLSIAVSKTTTICNGVTITMTVSGAQNYTWSTGSNASVLPVTPSVTTTYTVLGVNAEGCEGTQQRLVVVSKCSGIDEAELTGLFSLFPNPNNGEFFLSANQEMSLHLVNAAGQIIRIIELTASSRYKAQVDDLPNGIYFLQGQVQDQNISRRIVVSK